MRTLRSGKSLPDSSAVRRPASTTVAPKAESGKISTPTPRRGSTSALTGKETSSKKDPVIATSNKNETNKTTKQRAEVAKQNSIPKAEKETKLVEKVSEAKNGLGKSEGEGETAATDEAEEISGDVTSPTRGRPRKSARKSLPKVEVPPAPPTDRLAKTEMCQVCGMGFTRKATLLRHSKIHEEEPPEPEPRRRASAKIVKPVIPVSPAVITCDVCGLTFTRKAHLDRHALLHSGEKPFPCDLCSQKFTRKDHMLSHRVKHNGETLISCTVCGMNFLTMKSLDDHAQEEHPAADALPDTFTCETCGKYFLQKRYLQAHRKLHMRKLVELENFEYSELEYQSAKQGSGISPEPAETPIKSKKQASRPRQESADSQYQSGKEDTNEDPEEETSRLRRSLNGKKSNSQKPMVFLNRVVKLSADLALKTLKKCDGDAEVCGQEDDGEEENADGVEDMDLDYETMVKQYPVDGEADENSEDAYAYSSTHPQQLECSVCGKGFTDRATLRKHYRVHKKKFICRFCGLRLASAGSLMRHNLIHTGKKEFGCKLCGRKFSRKDTLAVHLSAHDKSTTRMNMPRPYLCKFCGASYTMKYNLIRHLKMCHSSSLKLIKNQLQTMGNDVDFSSASSSSAAEKDMVISLMPDLDNLPQRFDDEDGFENHKIKSEPIDYDEEENDQWDTFQDEEDNNFDEEEPQETDDVNNEALGEDDKYACNHCGKTFKNSKSLNTHKWYHSREKQFVCHICNRGFKYSTDLNRHLNTHALSKSKQSAMNFQMGPPPSLIIPKHPKIQSRQADFQVQQQKAVNNALQSRPFGCKLCPQRFNHRSNLSRHVRLLHNSVAARKRIPNSVNLQNYLKKLQVKRSGQMQINRIIQRQQQNLVKASEEADESWKSWNGMNLSESPLEGPSKFDDANNSAVKDFSFSIDLNSSRPFSCNVCGKAFENKSNLWTHMRIHNKAFSCSFCGLKVATHGDLVLHVRTHTGERPFSCDLCEWRFSRKSALNKHTQKYHTPGKGKVLRPWKYREERLGDNNGNLKFKFIRSSPQKDDFQIQKMGNANLRVAISQKATGLGNLPKLTQKSSPGMMPLKPLPRLAPAPTLQPNMKILKSVLQGGDMGMQRAAGKLLNTEPGPSPKLPLLQKSPAVSAILVGKPPGRTNVVFLCRKCKQLITGKANYIEHMKTHQTSLPENESQKVELKINRNFEDIAAKPFNCDECGQRFGQKAHLTRHQLSHQQSEAARCDICGKICSSLGFLSRHYQYVHPDTFNPAEQARFRVSEQDGKNARQDWSVPEVVMDDEDVEDQSEMDHSESHKLRPNHSSSNEDELDEEDGSHEPNHISPSRIGQDGTDVPIPCERCGKEFSSKKARSDHVWYCKRKKIHRCPVPDCNKEFKLKHDVVRHLKRHTNDKRFSCSVCQGRFYHKQDLDRHLRSVHKLILNDYPFPCDFCEMQYINEASLNRHMRLTHGVDSSDIAIEEDGSQGQLGQGLVRSRSSMEDEYEDFLIENDMDNEEYEEEGNDEMPDPSSFLEQSMGESSEQQQHDCELCGKSFSTRQKYMYHKYYHEREAKYNCTDCEEKFKLRSHLERHIRTYHNNLKPVNRILHCSQCPRKFTREYDLSTHISKIHTALTPPPHPLSILKTTLVMGDQEDEPPSPPTISVSKAKSDSLTEGTGQKKQSMPLLISNPALQNSDDSSGESEEKGVQEDDDIDQINDMCQGSDDPKAMGVKDGVFRHYNGTYTCELCGKIFKEKKSADAHRYYHNREEKYACQSCGARFKQNSDLQRHNRIHHNSANPKTSIHCPHCYRSFTDDRYMRMHIRRYHSEESQQGSTESWGTDGNVSGSGGSGRTSLKKNKSKLRIKDEPTDYDDAFEGDGSGATGIWKSDEDLVDLTIVENEDEEENSYVIENWGRSVGGESKGHDEDLYDQSGTEEDMNAIEEMEYQNYKGMKEMKEASSSKAQSCSVTCGSCGAKLEDTNAIKRHTCSGKESATSRRADTSAFDCKICGAKFARSNELILHNRVHTGVKPFICSICGKNFVQRADLNAHLQSEHNQSMQVFDCQFCPKKFFVRKSLDSHRRRHHGNIIQFHKCRQCGRQFTSQRFLDAHVRSCGAGDSK